MGTHTFGIDKKVVAKIQKELSIKHFIETGTYLAATACWAARHFHHISTVEENPNLHEKICAKTKDITNIEVFQGSSENMLPRMLATTNKELTLYWLDAHPLFETTQNQPSTLPLLQELKLIAEFGGEALIIIDDARLIFSPALAMESGAIYPTIDEIALMCQRSNHSTTILYSYDNIYIVPSKYAKIVSSIIKGNSLREELGNMLISKAIRLVPVSGIMRLRRFYRAIKN